MKKYFRSDHLCLQDVILLVAAVLLTFLVIRLGALSIYPIRTTSSVDAAYTARLADDDTIYVLDESHERLVHVDSQGNMLGEILSSDFGSGYMYIDDFAFDESGNVFLQGCEWDGMYLSQEYIYMFDASGNCLRCLYQEEYEHDAVNKHRIYAMNASDGQLNFLLLHDDSIEHVNEDYEATGFVTETVPYDNAFNAVSDALFSDSLYYILDKSGRVFETDGLELSLLWDLSDCEGAKACQPYRLARDDRQQIYFTDIRGERVCRITPGSTAIDTVYADTGTLTVTTGTYGGAPAYVITEYDSVSVISAAGGENLLTLTTLKKTASDIRHMFLALGVEILTALLLLVLLIRLVMLLHMHGISPHAKRQLLVLSMLTLVSGIIIYILMAQFSDRYRTQLCSQVENAAYMVATQVNADDIQSINSASDFGGAAYERLCGIMSSSYSKDVSFYDGVYCNILRYDGSGTAFAVAYLDQSIGTYFPLDDFESQEVIQVYETGKPVWNDGKADISGSYLYVKVPVWDENRNVAGVVAAGMDISSMNDTLREMVRQVLVAIIIVILLILLGISELTGFMNARDDYKALAASGTPALPGHSIRLLVFAVFTAYNISSTFLPVYIMNRTPSLSFLSKDLAASLPITINIFTIGVMSLFCAKLVQKLGLRTLTMISGLLSLAGNLLIFMVSSYPVIVLGLFLDGMGVGLVSNVLYIMITYVKDGEARRQGFTIYNAACLSGINFGMMMGAVLAVNLGERNVFAVVAVIWLVVILLTIRVSREVSGLLSGNAVEEEPMAHTAGETIGRGAFLKSKAVLGFFALIQNPYIIFNSFVFYYVPLFCSDHGYNETVTALLLMLYALLSVYTGEAITRMMTRVLGNRSMYLALLLNIIAVVLFAWHPDIRFMIAALIILSFSASFGKAFQQENFMEMDEVEHYRCGKDDAMGIYNFTENIGESIGPMIFGRIMYMQPLSVVVSVFGTIIAALGGIHFIGFRKKD